MEVNGAFAIHIIVHQLTNAKIGIGSNFEFNLLIHVHLLTDATGNA